MAVDFGSYMLVSDTDKRFVFGESGGMVGRRLDEIEEFLTTRSFVAADHVRIEIPLGSSVQAISRCRCGAALSLVRSSNDTTWLACTSLSQEIEMGIS